MPLYSAEDDETKLFLARLLGVKEMVSIIKEREIRIPWKDVPTGSKSRAEWERVLEGLGIPRALIVSPQRVSAQASVRLGPLPSNTPAGFRTLAPKLELATASPHVISGPAMVTSNTNPPEKRGRGRPRKSEQAEKKRSATGVVSPTQADKPSSAKKAKTGAPSSTQAVSATALQSPSTVHSPNWMPSPGTSRPESGQPSATSGTHSGATAASGLAVAPRVASVPRRRRADVDILNEPDEPPIMTAYGMGSLPRPATSHAPAQPYIPTTNAEAYTRYSSSHSAPHSLFPDLRGGNRPRSSR